MAEDKEPIEAEPVEGPGTELMKVMSEGDPDIMLALLEKKVALAPRFAAAVNALLVTQTYAADWSEHGGKMCLGSAGAERVARHFAIRMHDAKWSKQEFTDTIGKGYRYIYECFASLGDREVFVQGTYSTRDKFLSFKDDAYKATEDINESSIRSAAHHICTGNAIKALLGLRGIPADEWKKMMAAAGQDPAKAGKAQYGAGTQGGTSQDDTKHQQELAAICIAIANAGRTVQKDEKGQFVIAEMTDSDDRPELERAAEICCTISSFTTKDGKVVNGLPAGKLKDKRLDITLATARTLKGKL